MRAFRSDDELAGFLGIRWDDAQTTRLEIGPRCLNVAGVVAGSVTYAMLDYTMATALWVQTQEDEGIRTTQLAVNYLDAARDGELICRAEVDRLGRRTAALRGEVHHADGRLIATGIGSFAIFPWREAD